ncbi:hypothetical protein [Brassicibacter mesophilus]|uniref:hypothetical protein n=1 Tax=Brassicibacter mesophilus TaxID=745119 RepID=UPI003D1A9BDC
MKKIMIMAGSYYPKPMANGICVHQIALALKKIGYEVHIICFNKKGDKKEEEFEGVFIHRVKMRLFFKMRFYAEDQIDTWHGKLIYRTAMLLNKFKKILYLPLYPMTSPLFIYRYYIRSKEIHKEQNFDMILSVYNPLEALVAGTMMKKRYKDIKLGLYVLDSLTNGSKREFLPKSWTEKKGWQWERIFYSMSDVIFNMRCHEEHHKKSRYDKYREEMKIVDIPLFRTLNQGFHKQTKILDYGSFNWIYTGTLRMRNYNPWYAIKIFNIIQEKRKKMKFHFFSRGDCEEKLMEYERITEGAIVRHGFVESEISISAIMESDILISVGTSDSSMIPSKIFEYMSTGKPIIHFYKQENDVCLQYYNMYPLAICIKEDDELLRNNAEKIFAFIDDIKGRKVKFSDIKDRFVMNTPEYTTSIIDGIVDNK